MPHNFPPRPRPAKLGPFFWVLATVVALYAAAVFVLISQEDRKPLTSKTVPLKKSFRLDVDPNFEVDNRFVFGCKEYPRFRIYCIRESYDETESSGRRALQKVRSWR